MKNLLLLLSLNAINIKENIKCYDVSNEKHEPKNY